MRRGLMSWQQHEMPVAVLEARLRRLQQAMRDSGLQVMLAHTSFARPAVVHWLSNFTPYWSEAVLAVLPEGPPVLLAALTPRVHAWIRTVAHLGDLISAPRLGQQTADFVREKAPQGRVGVVDLDALPWSIGKALVASLGRERVVDASTLFRAVRQPADEAEQALARRASGIALQALAELPTQARTSAEVSSVVEACARRAGAEELLQRIAPDLQQDGVRHRLEGDFALGNQYAIELALAYKGVWVRVGRSVAQADEPAAWKDARQWFDSAVRQSTVLDAGAPTAGASVEELTLDATLGSYPLEVLAAKDVATSRELPVGSLCNVSACLRLPSGYWFESAPLVLREGGAERIDQVRG